LFKWQVIPSKQITPAEALAYVVFLQQIVALHSNPVAPPDLCRAAILCAKKECHEWAVLLAIVLTGLFVA
jgi:hypothetical protein